MVKKLPWRRASLPLAGMAMLLVLTGLAVIACESLYAFSFTTMAWGLCLLIHLYTQYLL
jgi:hypothetical protein